MARGDNNKIIHASGQSAQQLFIEAYVRNGSNGTRAAIAAGYAEEFARDTAYKLLNNQKIQQAIRAYQLKLLNGKMVNAALSVLTDIMHDESAPAGARVDCAKTILDRAGIGKSGGDGFNGQKNVNEMTHEELMSIINNYPKVIKDLSDNAQVVEGDVIP